MSKRYFSEDVMRRFLDTAQYEEFVNSYDSNKKTSVSRGMASVTDEDRVLFASFKELKSVGFAAKRHGVSNAKVQTAIQRCVVA